MAGKVLLEMASAQIEDLGDGVALLKFTAENGCVDSATAQWAADALTKAQDGVNAFVVEGCVGYDNNEVYGLVKEEDWSKLEKTTSQFQNLTKTISWLSKPVVAALKGDVMDFGLEIAMSAAAACETEAVLGLAVKKNRFSPMCGGLAELTLRAYSIGENVMGCDIVPFLKRAFQQVYLGKPCAGVEEARVKGLPIAMASSCGKENLVAKAKQKAMFLSDQRYAPRTKERSILATGTTGSAALEVMAINMRQGGFISQELLAIAADIAWVFGGGDVPKGTQVSETQLLRLEREAFLKACKRLARKEETV